MAKAVDYANQRKVEVAHDRSRRHVCPRCHRGASPRGAQHCFFCGDRDDGLRLTITAGIGIDVWSGWIAVSR